MRGDRTRVVLYGLGPIGMRTGKIILKRPWLEIVAAIDKAKEKAGKDLGEILGANDKLGIIVSEHPEEVFSRVKADIIVHATCSSLREVYSQIEQIIRARMRCVSSTEELFFPPLKNSELSQRIDTLAKEQGVTVLGTGVNPGFVMDMLPLLLTGVCEEIKTIKVERVVDASTRRLPLQQKIGVTLTPEEFRKRVQEKSLGHVGLVESLGFIAKNLGWSLDNIQERIDPVIAEEDISTQFFSIMKGRVVGIKHIAQGIKDKEVLLVLDLRMYVGAKNPHDTIHIEGNPSLSVKVKGGVPGDIATAAILANSIPLVMEAESGLINIKYPMVSHWTMYSREESFWVE